MIYAFVPCGLDLLNFCPEVETRKLISLQDSEVKGQNKIQKGHETNRSPFYLIVHRGLNLSNFALEAELVPRSLQYHKAKSGSQINEKPLFCFMVPGIGLEPIRPQWTQDFKSCVSTNSTTWAFLIRQW